MDRQKLAILFPGQGAYYKGVLATAREIYPQITSIFANIDEIARQEFDLVVSDVLFYELADKNDDLFSSSPALLQFALYGIDVAIYAILEAHGLQPDILIGHSFGEIAALVCAGAFTVQQGAFIVAQRVKALQKADTGNGYMAALGTNAIRTNKLLDLMGNKNVTVAVENDERQTVVSGPQEAMDAIGELSQLLKISFVKLNSPYPFHSPLLQSVVGEFAANIRHLKSQPLNVSVFSPIFKRYYSNDDILTDLLAQQLVLPLNFATAIRNMYAEGIRTFVECGALDTLAKLTKTILQTEEVDVLVSLDPKENELYSLNTLLQALEQHGYIPARSTDLRLSLADIFLPDIEQESFQAFWTVMGPQLLSHIKKEYETFTSNLVLISSPQRETPIVNEAIPQSANGASASNGAGKQGVSKNSEPENRDTLFQEVSQLYADALEYPIEVFSDEVELEAELGIDSVKQTELLARTSKRYHLPPRPASFRLSNYDTMGKVVDFIHSTRLKNGHDSAPSRADADRLHV